ncbi:sodium:solute symporter family protein [Tamlana sp. 2201CG12-4]|uniref:sodium:solute symporter family protein n=1 Tax=Tamlana sp. 2201CG12-4 TaxID=3112582 RepID=UPI002DB9101C|nr:sodium:solute symporter family protein [Tamlana sp. 2201CG12-4]MEC3908262.1 sodium:solute symporter family protein [Tamlana sp. 2201CG12-4]
MSNIDYITILAFSLLIVLAGLSFRKRGGDMKSYFAAGGAVPWSMSGLSLFMSFFSAGTFVVWGSIAYELGWVAITIQLGMCLGGFLVAYLIAPKWRNTNSLTAAEFVRNRLGDRTQKFYTYLILILSLGYSGAFLYPVAKIINVSTGFSINACVIALGLLILLYTVVGGLWAVIITDVLQFVILTAAVCIVVYLALQEVGGLSAFIDKAPENFFDWATAEYSWWFIVAFAIYNTIFIGGNWAYVQRYTSVKDAKSAKKVGLTFGWLYLLSPFIWMLPPMIYKVLNPTLGGLDNEGAYLLVCKEVLPLGMLGLMLGGMVFATASSVNTTLNLAASVITNDIFKVLKPQASLKQTMNVAKLSTLLFGLGTIVVALLVPAAGGIVNMVLSIGAVTGCSLYGPPIWALFSKRHTGKSILRITLLSLAINLMFKFFAEPVLGENLSRANEMLLGAILPFALLFTYELYAKFKTIEESEDYKNYQESTLLNAGEEEETETVEQNTFGIKVLAMTLIAVGILILILGIIAKDSSGIVLIMGSIVLLMALIIHPEIKTKLPFRVSKE